MTDKLGQAYRLREMQSEYRAACAGAMHLRLMRGKPQGLTGVKNAGEHGRQRPNRLTGAASNRFHGLAEAS